MSSGAEKKEVADVDSLLCTVRPPNNGDDNKAVQQIAQRKIVIFHLPPNTFPTDLCKCFSEYGAIEACNVARKTKDGVTENIGFVEFKSREVRNEVLKLHATQVIAGKEVTAMPFKPRLYATKEPKPKKIYQIKKFPLLDKQFDCCKSKECAFLSRSSVHLRLVASPKEPHPTDSEEPRRYSREELIKLNPRKTRMPGYFNQHNASAIKRIAPEIFKKPDPECPQSRRLVIKKADEDLLQKWENSSKYSVL
uniref:RRM domain-containing protein n=1 Tax=Steinernema glaseri TaxID=37863 RepID=A0A1I7YAD5_9BILA